MKFQFFRYTRRVWQEIKVFFFFTICFRNLNTNGKKYFTIFKKITSNFDFSPAMEVKGGEVLGQGCHESFETYFWNKIFQHSGPLSHWLVHLI